MFTLYNKLRSQCFKTRMVFWVMSFKTRKESYRIGKPDIESHWFQREDITTNLLQDFHSMVMWIQVWHTNKTPPLLKQWSPSLNVTYSPLVEEDVNQNNYLRKRRIHQCKNSLPQIKNQTQNCHLKVSKELFENLDLTV